MARFKTLINYWRNPYPYYYNQLGYLMKVLLVIGALSFGFMYVFEPFTVNVQEHRMPYIVICSIHGFLPVPIALCYFGILDRFRMHTKRWTFGKEFVHLTLVLICIGMGSFLVRDIIYNNPHNWSWYYLGRELRNTVWIGVLLLVLIIPLNLERLYKKYQKASQQVPVNTSDVITHRTITITEPNTNNQWHLKTDQFLFAEVEGNYTELVYVVDGELQKGLLRIPLKVLEIQLASTSHIFRSHRSFLVNLNQVISVSGNAQGYRLQLKHYSGDIPVSRSRIPAFDMAWKAKA